jgi:MoaA/NifB/PqqE/SkfB family radical SAM enzyme
MCDCWKKDSWHELKIDEISNILSQLPEMDIVRLSGGEPFLREDLLEITHIVQEKLNPQAVIITTNGFLSDRIVRYCEDRNKVRPLHLLISLDGIGEKHNYVRGRKKAFDQVVKTLKNLTRRQNELKIVLGVNQVVVDEDGVEEYKRVRDFLLPFGIRNNIILAYDASAMYHPAHEVNLGPKRAGEFSVPTEINKSRLEHLFDTAERDIDGFPFVNRILKQYYLKGIKNRLLNGTALPNPTCVALNSHLRLLPDGAIPTCQQNTFLVGNLQYQRFEDVWTGDSIQTQREWVRNCPGCWAECEVLPNALYSGDLINFFASRRLSSFKLR